MAFFPIRQYRLYDDPFDRFFGDQLDLFDPWRDLDTFPTALAIQPNAFRWVNQPQRSLTHNARSSQTPSSSAPHAEKFRVQLNVAGFNPETINTKVEGRKVIIEAKQEDKQGDGDYHIRQLRKSYQLPEHAGMYLVFASISLRTHRSVLLYRCKSFDIIHHTKQYARHRSSHSES